MAAQLGSVTPPGRVLSTLNVDGTRQWLRPKLSRGRYWKRRRALAYLLMLVFFLIPYLRMSGKPLVLLDLPHRQFTLFGTTFLPTETVLFMLLFLGSVIAIFLATALFGRVWCGWACPQTVYLEFLFRPVEYWLEGGPRGTQGMDRRRGLHARRLVKHALYLVFALFLAHTFLAYFVGIERLAEWVRRSPAEHPTSFLVMLGTTALIFFDFAWFREQTCLVACPYGRLQSVLLDRRSLIVGYDPRRGEPRAKGNRLRPAAAGDCIDCSLCVLTCPTGIDIRDGLQMECIHCTQCADACDAVMAKIGKPSGLIRYGSRDQFEGRRNRWLRPRVVLYPVALALALGAFVWLLGTRADAEVTLLRGLDVPYTVEQDGSVVNQIRIKFTSRGGADRSYHIALADVPEARLIAPINPFPVPGGAMRTTSVFVLMPRDGFVDGERAVRVLLTDGRRFSAYFPYRLVGPEGRPAGASGGGQAGQGRGGEERP